jgi:hypothetical protein
MFSPNQRYLYLESLVLSIVRGAVILSAPPWPDTAKSVTSRSAASLKYSYPISVGCVGIFFNLKSLKLK